MERNPVAKTWQIDTIDELKAFRDEVNSGKSFAGWTITLGEDIDLSGENWTSIGNVTNSFQGTFDGDGHTISGLTINNSTLDYAGFFGFIDAGSVKDVTFENVTINARNYVGTVVGYTNAEYGDCVISGVTVTGTVMITGASAVGGIAGGGDASLAEVTINATGTLNGIAGTSGDVGGIIGRAENDNKEYGDGEYQYSGLASNINVKGIGAGVNSVGGVIGSADAGIYVDGIVCTAKSVDADGIAEEGKDCVGGLVGAYGEKVTLNDASLKGTVISGSYIQESDGKEITNENVVDNFFSGEGASVITVNSLDDLEVGFDVVLINTDLTAGNLSVKPDVTFILKNSQTVFTDLDIHGSVELAALESSVKGIDMTLGDNAKITIDASGITKGCKRVFDLSDPDGSFAEENGTRIVVNNLAEGVNVFYALDGDISISDADANNVYLVNDVDDEAGFGKEYASKAYVGINVFNVTEKAYYFSNLMEPEFFNIKGSFEIDAAFVNNADRTLSFLKLKDADAAAITFKSAENTIAGVFGIGAGVAFTLTGTADISGKIALDGTLTVAGADLADAVITAGEEGRVVSAGVLNVLGSGVIFNGGTYDVATITLGDKAVLDIAADTVITGVINDLNNGTIALYNGASFTAENEISINRIYVGYDYSEKADSTGAVFNVAEDVKVTIGTIVARAGNIVNVEGVLSGDYFYFYGAEANVAEGGTMTVGGQGLKLLKGANLLVQGTLDWADAAELTINAGTSVTFDGGDLLATGNAAVVNNGTLNVNGEVTLQFAALSGAGVVNFTDAVLGADSVFNSDSAEMVYVFDGDNTINVDMTLATSYIDGATLTGATFQVGAAIDKAATLTLADGVKLNLSTYFGIGGEGEEFAAHTLNLGNGSALALTDFNNLFVVKQSGVINAAGGSITASEIKIAGDANLTEGATVDANQMNLYGEEGADSASMSIVNSTVTVRDGLNVGHRTNSERTGELLLDNATVEGGLTVNASGSVNVAANSQIVGDILNAGTVTIAQGSCLGADTLVNSGEGKVLFDAERFTGFAKILDLNTDVISEGLVTLVNGEGISFVYHEDGDVLVTDGDLTVFTVDNSFSGEYGEEVGDKLYFGVNAYGSMDSAVEALTPVVNEINAVEGKDAALHVSVYTENPNGLVVNMGNNGLSFDSNGGYQLAEGVTMATAVGAEIWGHGDIVIGEGVTVNADVLWANDSSCTIEGTVNVNGAYMHLGGVNVEGLLNISDKIFMTAMNTAGIEVAEDGELVVDAIYRGEGDNETLILVNGTATVNTIKNGSIITVGESGDLNVNSSVEADALTVNGTLDIAKGAVITAGTLTGAGQVTFDVTGFAGTLKVLDIVDSIDFNGTFNYSNQADNVTVLTLEDGDIVLTDADFTKYAVNNDYAALEYGTAIDGLACTYAGINAFGDMSTAMAALTETETTITITGDTILTGKTGVFAADWNPDQDAGEVALYDLAGKTVTWSAVDGALLDVAARHVVLHGEGTLNIAESVTIDYRQASGAGLGESLFAVGSFWTGDTSTAKTTVNLDGKIIVGDVALSGDNGSVKVRHGNLYVSETGSIDADYSIRVRDGLLDVTGSGKDAAVAQLKSQRLEISGDSVTGGKAEAIIRNSYVSITYGGGKIADRFDSNTDGYGYDKSFNFIDSRVEAGSLALNDAITTFEAEGTDFSFKNVDNAASITLEGSSLIASTKFANTGSVVLNGKNTLNINNFTGNAIVAADGATLTDSTIKGGTGYTSVETNGYNFVLSVNGDEAGTLNLEGENTLQNIEAGAGDTVNVTGALHFVSGSDGFKLGNGATWNINNAVIDGAWALSLDGAYMPDDDNAPVSTMTFTDSTLTVNQISAKGVKEGQEIGYGIFNVNFVNSDVYLSNNRLQIQAQETADVNISFTEGSTVEAGRFINYSSRGTVTFDGSEAEFTTNFGNAGTVNVQNEAVVSAVISPDNPQANWQFGGEMWSGNKGTINVDGATLTMTGAAFINDGTFNVSGVSTLNIAGVSGNAVQALDGANLDNSNVGGTVEAQNNLSFTGDNYVKTLKAVNGGTILVEEGKTLALGNFSFGSSATAGNKYIIDGGKITANYGFFQHGVYTLNADFETGYMYYSYGSDITVNGSFHSRGEGDGLDYVRGKLTVAAGGESVHDRTLWIGQPASWGEMAASLTVAGYVQAGTLQVYSGSSFAISKGGLVLTDKFIAEEGAGFEINTVTDDKAEMTVNSFSFDGTLTINAAEGFSGVEQVVDVTGSANYSNEDVVVNGATFARGWDGDVYIHTLSLEYIQVNAAWEGLAFATEVAEGYHIGINAFAGFNAAYNAKTDETKAVVILSDEEDALSGNTYSGKFIAGEGLNVTVSSSTSGYVTFDGVEIGAGVKFDAASYYMIGENTVDGEINSSSVFYSYDDSKTTINGKVTGYTIMSRYYASADNGIYVVGSAAAGEGVNADVQFKSTNYLGHYSGTFSVKNTAAEFGYILLGHDAEVSHIGDNSELAAKLVLDNARVSTIGGANTQPGQVLMVHGASIAAANGSLLDFIGPKEFGYLSMAEGTSITLTDSAMLLGREGQGGNTINGTITMASSKLSSLGTINVGATGSITTAASEKGGINEITAVKIDNQGTISVGGTSTLNIGTLTGNSIELLDGAVIKDSTVGGTVSVEGAVTFNGDNTFENIADFGTAYTPNQKWSVAAGGSVTLTGKDKYGLGYGDNVTINGELVDAKAAYAAGLDADAADFSARGGVIAMTNSGYADTTSYFTAENAYIRIGMDDLDMSFSNRAKSDGASGAYVFSFTNSVLEANSFNFQETEGLGNGKYTFNFTNSVLAAGPFNTNDKDSVFTFDNSVMTAAYDSTNGGALSFVNGSVASYENLVLTNNGELFIADSTFTAGEVSGSGTFTVGAGDSELNVGALKQDIYANQNSSEAITLSGGIGATSNAIRVYGDAELSGFDVNAGYVGKLISGTGRVNVYGNTVIGDNTVMNLNAFQTTNSGVIKAGSVINTANFNAFDMGAADDGTVVDARFVIEGTVNAVSFIVTNDRYSSNGKDELIVAKDGVVTATYMSGAGRFSLQTGAVTVYGYVYGDLSSGGGSSNIGSTSKRADGENYAMTVTVDGTYASEDSNNGKFIKVGSQKLFIYEGSALNVINGATFSWDNTVDNSGSITVTDSSFTAGTVVNSGSITVDGTSTFTAADITRDGQIIIDAANFAGGVKKIINLTSTSLEGSVSVINLGDNNVFYGADGDVYLTDSDRSTLYVGDVYAGYEFGTGVNGNVVGYNAYDYIADAVNSAMTDSEVGRVQVEAGNTAELYNWAVDNSITTVNPNGLVIDLGNNGQSWHWGDIDMATGEAPAADQPYSQISNSLADFTIGENVTVIADALLCVGFGNFKVEGAVEVNAAFAQGHGLDISGVLTVNDWMTLSANGTEDYLLVRNGGVLNAAKADISAGFDFTVDGTASLNNVISEAELYVTKNGTLNLTNYGDIAAVINEGKLNVSGSETDSLVAADVIFNSGVAELKGGKLTADMIEMQYGAWELGGFTASDTDRTIEVSFIKDGDSLDEGISFTIILKAGETTVSGLAFMGMFGDNALDSYLTLGNYTVTAADKEFFYSVKGSMTINQGAFNVTGNPAELDAVFRNGIVNVIDGANLKNSEVTADVNVDGSQITASAITGNVALANSSAVSASTITGNVESDSSSVSTSAVTGNVALTASQLADSTVSGVVTVYGDGNAISGETSVANLYVGYPSLYEIDSAAEVTITGSFTSTSNFVVGKFGTVNIGTATVGSRTTVNAKSTSWANGSVVNLTNADFVGTQALSMTGTVTLTNSTILNKWEGQMNVGNGSGKVTLKKNSSLEYTTYFYIGGYYENGEAVLEVTDSTVKGKWIRTSDKAVMTFDNSSLIATSSLSLKGELTLTDSLLDAASLVITESGKINADWDSAIEFDALSNEGVITFDMSGAEGCILKVMDYTGSASMDLAAYGNVNAGELYSSFRVYNNDLYAVTADFSEMSVTLCTDWAGAADYELVAAGALYGVNATGSFDELAAGLVTGVASNVEKLTILNSEGDLGDFEFTRPTVVLNIVDSDVSADLNMTGADVTIAEGSVFEGTITANASFKLSGTGVIDGTLCGSNSGNLTIADTTAITAIEGFTSIVANEFSAGSIAMTLGSDIFYVNGDLTVDGNIDFLTGYEDAMVIASGVTVDAAAIEGSGNFAITMDYAGEAAINVSGNGAFATNSNLVINLNSFVADADGSSLLVSGIDAFAGSVVIGGAQLSLGDRIFNGSMLELAITEEGLAFVQAEGDFGVRGDVDNNGLSDILLFNTADNTLSALLSTADGCTMDEIGTLEGSQITILGTGKVSGIETEGQSIFYQADSTIKACVMNDGELTETRDIWQVADNGAEVIGLGDFNNDGATDLLVAVPQDADGGSAIGYITEGEWNYFQSLGSEWEVTHVGDFNGDGRDDVVLEHGAGFAGAWLIKEDGTPEWAGLDSIANVNTCGVGDFNGDGIDDILVRNGEWVGAWIIGTDGDSSNGLVDSFIGIKGDLAVENTIEQIGDYNGDGVDDIVIRTAAGDLGVLSINGDSTEWKYCTTLSSDITVC